MDLKNVLSKLVGQKQKKKRIVQTFAKKWKVYFP